jgi:hypothetical protein
MKIKIIWQETGDFALTDKNIKTTAIGKGFVEYEGNFNHEEFVEFMNFQLKRACKLRSNIKIISTQFCE